MKQIFPFSSKIHIISVFYSIVIFLFLSFSEARSQSLTGTIKNNDDAAISNSVIYLKSLSNEQKRYYQNTDVNGKFTFRLVAGGTYVMSIKSIGFVAYLDTLSITSDIDLGILKLKHVQDTLSKFIALKEVKVYSQKSIITHLADREIVDVENSYLGKLPNTRDLLNQIPEITVIDGNSIAVLGKTGVAIFVNGHQSNLQIQSIPIQNIAKIEVISNPSAKYDGNMEAVINVIFKKGVLNGLQGDFFTNFERKSGNLYSVGGTLNYNTGIFNSSLNIAYYEATSNKGKTNSNSVFQNNNPVYALNTDLNESSYAYLVNIDLEMALLLNKNNKISFNGTWQPNYTPRDIYIEKDVFTNNVTAKVDSSSSSNVRWSYHTRYANGGISYTNTNKFLSSDARFDVFWQDDGTKTFNNFLFNNFNSFNDNTPVLINTDQYRKSIAYVPSVNFSHPFKKSKLEFGAKYYHITSNFYLNFSAINFFTPDQNNVFSSEENIYAGYVNYQGSFKKLSYELGLRNEYSTLRGAFNNSLNNYDLSKLLPSALINYPVSKNSKLTFSYSKKLNRVPFSRETPLFYYTGPFTAFEGNPLLRPQTLQALQLKYVYKSYYATLYYNNYKNFLSALPFIEGNTTILKFTNYDRVNYGVILGSPVTFDTWWSSQNTLRVYHQSSSGVIDSVKFDEGSWTSNINIAENFKIKKLFSASLLFNYTLPYFAGVNKIRTGASLDLNLTKSIASKHMDISLYARDILNTYSYSHISRNSGGVKYNSTLQKDTRGISLSLKYNFQKGRSTVQVPGSNDEIKSRL